MTTGNEDDTTAGGAENQPNVSPELQDAIRSIDAIGENAWGKDDDEDAPRQPKPDTADASSERGPEDGLDPN